MEAQPRSWHLDVDGPVHVADYGDPEAPAVLCVHGLAGSHVGWRSFAQQMSGTHRVLALDLPGHGRSPLLGRPATVAANRRVLDRVLEELGATAVTVVGHSMGAAVAVVQAAAEPASFHGLVLLAPPTPRSLGHLLNPVVARHVVLCAWPWAARTALRRGCRWDALGATPAELELAGVLSQEAGVSSQDADAAARSLVELSGTKADGDGVATFVEAARSVGLLVARANAYRQVLASVRVPTLVVQGGRDRIVSPSGLRQLSVLRPGWTLELLAEVGHSPHLEAPGQVVDLVKRHMGLDSAGVPSAGMGEAARMSEYVAGVELVC